MGLFGNKEGKGGKEVAGSKDAPLVQTKPVESGSAQVVVAETDGTNTLNSWFKSSQGCYREWRTKSCGWCDSPQWQEANRWRKEFAGQFCHPLGQFYRSFPEELTEFKHSAFGKYSYKERLFGLEAAALLTAISTLRIGRSQFGFTKRFLLAVRNSTFTYLIGGLLVAPQIYNPLIKSDF